MSYELFFCTTEDTEFHRVFFLLFVFQRSIPTKELGYIHFWLRCVTGILRYALDDKYE